MNCNRGEIVVATQLCMLLYPGQAPPVSELNKSVICKQSHRSIGAKIAIFLCVLCVNSIAKRIYLYFYL